jgi:hypothetical protein
MADCSPSEPVWNWSTAPQTSVFCPRRIAHETALHRWDAQASHGIEGSIEPILTEDGIAEVIDVWLPSFLGEHPDVTVPGSMGVRCVDRLVSGAGGRWRKSPRDP